MQIRRFAVVYLSQDSMISSSQVNCTGTHLRGRTLLIRKLGRSDATNDAEKAPRIAPELMERQIRHCELPVRNDNVEGARFASDSESPPTVSSRPSSEGSSGVKTPRTKRRRPITSENVRYRCEPRQIPAKGRKTRTSNSEARRVGSRKGW